MPRHALLIVENNSVPFDRRVWREAVSLRNAGWDVSVISPVGAPFSRGGRAVTGEDAAYEERDGIRIYRYALKPAEGAPLAFAREYLSALWRTLRLTVRVWRRQRIDVVQVCNPPDFFFLLGWLCRPFGVAFIFDHHDLVPESIAERWRGAMGKLLQRIALLSEWMTLRAAHVVMATNQSYRDVAKDRGGVSDERIVVLRNGPLLERCRRVGVDPAIRNGRQYLVGYLGIMGPQDGLPLLAAAIRHVVRERGRDDIQFLIVGDGPMRPWMADYAREWQLTDYITLPGLAVTLDECQAYLSAPDLCVSPEPPTVFNSKSTITKVAEYMAMRQPVVAFDLEETRRTAGDAAVFVTPPTPEVLGDAIVALLDDPSRRKELADRGHQRAIDHLVWEVQEPALLDAYERAFRAVQRRNARVDPQGERRIDFTP